MMTRTRWALLGTGLFTAAIAVMAARPGLAERAPGPEALARLATSHADPGTSPTADLQAPAASSIDPEAVVSGYCKSCHNDMMMRGGFSLASFAMDGVTDQPELAEKMIRKLQAGLMPPPGSKRPDVEAYAGLITALERAMDEAAKARPNPGVKTFQRLNRPEYARAVHDMLALDVDAGAWLPLDQKSANFDNIADEQVLSPILLEAYLNAAADISRLAVGDPEAPTLGKTYTNTSYVSQHPWDHVDGAPYGTRGGMVVDHIFPADAEYVFELSFTSGDNARFEDIDLSIDGERVALVRYETGQAGGADGRGAVPMKTDPILVKAGQHKVAAAFVRRTDGPYEDLIRPHDWSYAGGGSGGIGITTLPHLRDLIVRGPYEATGVSETASRRRIFSCRPTALAEERPCARSIASRLGGQAYRRSLTDREIDVLMQFFAAGAADGGFETGIRTLVEALLASPHFIFRIERQPSSVQPGQIYRLSDVDLAARLSFFLWGAPPDDELQGLAEAGTLSAPGVLEAQTRRMLSDARSRALGPRFAAQWLRLQDVDKVHPDPNFFPNFDSNLADAMKGETQEFFIDLLRADRSVLDLYRADYSFLNERLARHYGIPGVAGGAYRKVAYPDDTRRGLLGQGAILVQTSLANRTSPVLRGKWVMEVLMGTPPPPPPPDIPALEETAEAKDGRVLTTRERMELHRADPTCNSCHRFMDPIGLALDNFDVTGKWREHETGMPLDTRGDYYDGTPVSSPAELSAALLRRPVPLVRTFTENLLSYALGRRVEYYDQPTVRAIARAAEVDGYRISSLIVGVVTSDAFQMKQAEPDTAAAGKTTGRR
jgi:hypothetical protein